MIVERLHVQITVDRQLAVVGNGVTQGGTVFQLCAAHPVVGGRIVGVGRQPVEDGQFVERQLVGSREGLPIVERRAEVLDAMPDGVLPGRIAVRVEVLVDGQAVAIGFLDFGARSRLEIHVEVLGKVPAQTEVTVPKERRAPLHGYSCAREVVHVALLQLVIAALHLGIERHVLWEPVQSEGLRELHPFRL